MPLHHWGVLSLTVLWSSYHLRHSGAVEITGQCAHHVQIFLKSNHGRSARTQHLYLRLSSGEQHQRHSQRSPHSNRERLARRAQCLQALRMLKLFHGLPQTIQIDFWNRTTPSEYHGWSLRLSCHEYVSTRRLGVISQCPYRCSCSDVPCRGGSYILLSLHLLLSLDYRLCFRESASPELEHTIYQPHSFPYLVGW